VENAVYHGVAQLSAGGTVRVSVQRQPDAVLVVVENPAPRNPARTGGHHMALENIRQRLQVLFGSLGQLRIDPTGDRFRVELQYPLQVAA
jgi:two-component system sensor histidine kinase AlgZ